MKTLKVLFRSSANVTMLSEDDFTKRTTFDSVGIFAHFMSFIVAKLQKICQSKMIRVFLVFALTLGQECP